MLYLLFSLLMLRPEPVMNACAARSAAGPSAFLMVDRVPGSDTLALVTVCLVTDTSRLRVGGYHGELTLPHSARVVRVERPSGGTRIENTTAPGRVSFAGVASDGVGSGAVLGITIARRDSRDDARLRLTIIDVTDIKGHGVRPQIAVDTMPRLTHER